MNEYIAAENIKLFAAVEAVMTDLTKADQKRARDAMKRLAGDDVSPDDWRWLDWQLRFLVNRHTPIGEADRALVARGRELFRVFCVAPHRLTPLLDSSGAPKFQIEDETRAALVKWIAESEQPERLARATSAAELRYRYYRDVSVEPSPALIAMWGVVFRKDGKVRSPKWTFRIAPDLVMQLQARATRKNSPYFEGSARLHARPVETFDQAITGGVFSTNFEVYAEQPERWRFRARGVHGDWQNHAFPTRDRAIAAFNERRFDNVMAWGFSGHCVCCGKALTDPTSMARHIGPECANDASVVLPVMLRAAEAT